MVMKFQVNPERMESKDGGSRCRHYLMWLVPLTGPQLRCPQDSSLMLFYIIHPV